LESSELVEYNQGNENTIAVDGILRNTSNQELSYVVAEAQFLDGSDVVIGEFLSNIRPLLSRDGWKFRIDYYSEQDIQPSEVQSYNLFADYRQGSVPSSPDLEIAESELVEKTEFGETTKMVQGVIRNTGNSPLDYVEANAQFLNSDDVVVSDFFSNTENLQPGNGWAFEVRYYSETDTPPSEVVDYHLFATT